MKCPICGIGFLKKKIRLERVSFAASRIETRFSVCSYCEIEQADAAELKFNKDRELLRLRYE